MHRRPRLPMILLVLLLALAGPMLIATPADAAPASGSVTASTHAASSSAAVASSTAAPRTMKVLVVRAYFDHNTDSTASVQKLFGQTNSWFGAVSGHRFHISPTITPAYKLPNHCHGIEDRASAAAARHGYHLNRYQLVVVLAPTCGMQNYYEHAELDTMVPRHLVLWGSAGRTQAVVVHQFGHALGLDDSLALSCRVGSRWVTIGSSKQCVGVSAGEDVDVMGGGPVIGSFSAPELARLHWFGSGQATYRTSGTSNFTLHPLLGTGLRTIRVQANSDVTYWLEYRTRTGVDARMHSSVIGVIVRRVSARENRLWGNTLRPAVIDMNPGWWLDALRAGSSWTAPEGVSIAVSSIDDRGAHVTVRFKAPRPAVPAAPRIVSVVNGEYQVYVNWTKPADHGRPITWYEISPVDAKGHAPDTFDRYSADTPTMEVPLAQGIYTIRIRALNDMGASTWATARGEPQPAVPSVRIVSPAEHEVVNGRYLKLTIAAAPNPVSRSPITVSIGLGASETQAQYVGNGLWTATIDLLTIPEGTLTVRVLAESQDTRWATVMVDVEVPPRFSAPMITSPAPGTVWSSGLLPVTVVPGVDRLTGETAPSVKVQVGGVSRMASAANDWTVSFDRGELFNVPTAVYAESDGPPALTSPRAEVPITWS